MNSRFTVKQGFHKNLREKNENTSIKLAYLLMVHKNQPQVIRLIRSLNSENTAFFIHIDKKSDILLTPNELGAVKIVPVEREYVKWGGFSQVTATLNGMKAIVNYPESFDYIIFLSGQCYPLKSNLFIKRFFEQHYGQIFIDYFPMPYAGWEYGGMNRIEQYHFMDENPPDDETISALPPRKFPEYLKPYGGSNWWCLPMNTAKYVLEFVDNHPDYFEFHKYSAMPDEMFFQTILLNSDNHQILDNIVCDGLRYIDWTKPDPPYPAILTTGDFPSIINSGKLFARKFDTEIDSQVLDMIDQQRK